MSENGEIYTAGKKFYTPAGTDGMDKFHLWYPQARCHPENRKIKHSSATNKLYSRLS